MPLCVYRPILPGSSALPSPLYMTVLQPQHTHGLSCGPYGPPPFLSCLCQQIAPTLTRPARVCVFLGPCWPWLFLLMLWAPFLLNTCTSDTPTGCLVARMRHHLSFGGTIKKDQPMRRQFLSLLSDALLPTLADDVAAAVQPLREHGVTDAQIANLREHHWRDQLTKGCRRFSGNDPEAQLRRVIKAVLECFATIRGTSALKGYHQ